MSEELNKIEELVNRLKAYLNTRLSQLKLSTAEKIASVLTVLIAVLLAALVFFLFFTMVCVGVALLIGSWLQNYWLGFFIVSGLILVAGGWGWLTRDRWLRIPIMNLLIRALFKDEDDEKDLAEVRIQAEDQQRYEIGQDLHDGVGQMLVVINMYIGIIRSKGTLTKKELKTLEGAIQKTIEQVRNLSRLLAPPELKDIGLRESIRELIDTCSIMKKPSFKLEIYPAEDDYNLNLDKKRMVYRVVQELLNNTFKHAKAENVELKLFFDKKNFYLHYQDDGQGFDQNKIKKGIGLDSIESRIKYHKGILKLESTPEKGSNTTITLPIG